VRRTLTEDNGGGLAFQQVAFSPDGRAIAATVSEQVNRGNALLIRTVVKIWDAKTLALKRTVGNDDSDLVCFAMSPDGRRLATGDPAKKTVQLWNAGTGALERTLATDAQPWSVAFSPDSRTVVAGGQRADHSGVVSLWNVETGKLIHVFKREQYVNRAVFSPDGKLVASGGAGGEIELWDAASGKQVIVLRGLGRRGTRTVAFSPDGRTLAAGGTDGNIRLWDVKTGKLKRMLEGHDDEVHCVAFSPDGTMLAGVSQDETLRLWTFGKRGGE
jgi:WD40 repeat protein